MPRSYASRLYRSTRRTRKTRTMSPYDASHPISGDHHWFIFDVEVIDEQKVRAEALAFTLRGATCYVHYHEKPEQGVDACIPGKCSVEWLDIAGEYCRLERDSRGFIAA
jgi:hypothetical protein